MENKLINPKITAYILGGAILLLILVKIPHLFAPYFWDEAWSYMNAIYSLSDNWTALFPGQGSIHLTKGHPILFFALSTFWINLFGEDLYMVHLLPLIISCITVVVTYRVGKNLFDSTTGLFAAALLSVQTVFMAQSTMMLPEILLALFMLLAIDNYLRQKIIRAVLWSVCAILTKEAGIVVVLFMVSSYLLTNIKKLGNKTVLTNSLLLSTPLFVYLIHIVLHKIYDGWYFYPDHTSYINFELQQIYNRFSRYALFLFQRQGRVVLLVISLIAVIYLFITKKIKDIKYEYLIQIIAFIFWYFAFLSVNFHSPRYVLSVLSPLIIIYSYCISTFIKIETLKLSVFALLLSFYIYNYSSERSNSDFTFGSIEIANVNRSAVRYCQNNYAKTSKIMTSFLMTHYMNNLRLGYLQNTHSKTDNFDLFVNNIDDKPDVIVMSTAEPSGKFIVEKIAAEYMLVKTFENKLMQTNIYERKKTVSIGNQ